MAKYEGETIRLKVTATDYDGDFITGDQATPPTGSVILYDANGVEYLTAALTWGVDEQYWYYDWNTTEGDAGTYKVRIRFVGISYDTWDYGRVQLKVNPVDISP